MLFTNHNLTKHSQMHNGRRIEAAKADKEDPLGRRRRRSGHVDQPNRDDKMM